jgi:hypothetical protein
MPDFLRWRQPHDVRCGSKTVMTPLRWDVSVLPLKADVDQPRLEMTF